MKPHPPALPAHFRSPPHVMANPGCLRHLWEECHRLGGVGLLVHGHSLSRSGRLEPLLKHVPRDLRVVPHAHEGGEPTLSQLDRLRSTAHAARVGWIAGVGGGSVLDLAKAAAALVNAPQPSQAFHDGLAVPAGGVPWVAVPTTAGTGSEATGVAVLINSETGLKKSFRSPWLQARTVLLDPELLEEAPRSVIAASGMDALTQAIESYVSKSASPFTRALSKLAFERIVHALLPVYDGHRTGCADMLQGSYLAGLALDHARLGLVHGLAHPLGAQLGLPHGEVCARCLPAVLRFNAERCQGDFEQLSEGLGEPLQAFVDRALDHLHFEPRFERPAPDVVERMVQEVLASGSTRSNPRPVSAGDARTVLETLFGDRG